MTRKLMVSVKPPWVIVNGTLRPSGVLFGTVTLI